MNVEKIIKYVPSIKVLPDCFIKARSIKFIMQLYINIKHIINKQDIIIVKAETLINIVKLFNIIKLVNIKISCDILET